MSLRFLICCLLLTVVVGCTKVREGFTNYDSGLSYQLHTIGENESKITYQDYITCSLFLENADHDTVYFDAFPISIQLKDHSKLDKLITKFSKNDSVSIELNQMKIPISNTSFKKLFGKKIKSEILLMHLKILEVNSAYKFKEDSFAYFNKPVQNEIRLIEKYLRLNNIDSTSYRDGIFLKKIFKTSGKPVKFGDRIKIEFIGRFFDGRIFDNTNRWNEEFVIEFGKPMQIIRGLEIALSSMNEGEVAKIILPSHLAFGKMGSKAAKVPPFTPILYELKLTKIY